MDPTLDRRDFILKGMSFLPVLALTIPAPREMAPEKDYNIELVWTTESETWLVWHFGFGETHLFNPGPSSPTRWNIRCGKLWRPGELFTGTIDEAKAEAQRFTLEKFKMGVIAAEKIVYAIKRPQP